ncbi:MAG: HsdR family type I site-specific deoxyribonuclease [Candidatus Nanoarchaeia archaeon]
MTQQNEKKLVENYMIDKFVNQNKWTYIPGGKLERESNEEPLLIKNLVSAIKKINDTNLSEEDIQEVLKQLRLRGVGVDDSKKILGFFKFGVSVKLSKTKELVRVKLFDYDHVDNNEFIVTNQIHYESSAGEIIPDIVLYVNGIPLVIIECKDMTSSSTSWKDAYNDIVGIYRNKVREPFKYFQIGVAAEQKVKYFPIVSWAEDIKVCEWRDENRIELGTDSSMTGIFEMLTKEGLLNLIRDFIFVREEGGEKTKVITRYMQYRAVNKIVDRVKTNIEGKEKKNKGLVWHWQGSGKTLTMAFAAHKLYYLKELENPTLFFILDRTELEEQMYNELNALEMPKVESIGSIQELKRILEYDEGKGKRGLFTILIHKFRPGDFEDLRKELENKDVDKQTFLTRKNVIAFIDESHRSQYGLLASQMKALLKNAFFFAFTGTPINKKDNKNTYLEFAYPPTELYLDKYFIKDAISDGFTLKIAYQPRLEKEVHLKTDQLTILLEAEDVELPDEKRKEFQERVKKNITIQKAYYKNRERIKRISEDITKHFKENLDGRFKAMIVAVDREACVHYKEELDKLLPGYSEIVMTFTSDERSKDIQEYLNKLHERFPNKELSEIMKEITGKFKEEENPKILIVTDMLLTGFDAPILQTMYLDKPLREHRLLQAIARTNRPFKNVKEAGLIVDYLGILKEFKKAFEIYTKEDIKGALYDLNEIKKEFEDLLKETLDLFKDYPERKLDSRVYLLEIVRSLLADSLKLRKFIDNIKELRKKFELLGSDESKVIYYKELIWLEAIYETYKKEVYQETEDETDTYLRKYFAKTIRFIHKSTEIENLKENLPVIDFDENYIKKLEEKYKTKEERAANIVFTLNRYILVDRDDKKLYETLIDKVQRLFDSWRTKTKDFETIYKEGIKIIQERNKLLQRKKDLKLSNFEFSSLILLEKKIGEEKVLIEDIKELAKELFSEKYIFTNWTSQIFTKKEIQKVIRKLLLGYIKKYNLSIEDVNELSLKIFENLKQYEKRG